MSKLKIKEQIYVTLRKRDTLQERDKGKDEGNGGNNT